MGPAALLAADRTAYPEQGWRAAERREAEARGEKLLREWLSPAQLAQYEAHRHFEVTGCDSGTRYRILHGRQFNIDELDARGGKVCEWCFVPEGDLVVGDVMLAQKIALETAEHATLAVANSVASRFYPANFSTRATSALDVIEGRWT